MYSRDTVHVYICYASIYAVFSNPVVQVLLRQLQLGSGTASPPLLAAAGGVAPWLGNGADGPACRAALRAGSEESEKLLLRRLLAGAMWTVARVSGHGTRANAVCPDCGAEHEDEAHILWDCPEWGDARGTWLPRLSDSAGAIPNFRPPHWWPSCLRKAGPVPLRLAQGVERDLLDEVLYRLYGMYLVVLAARMAASAGDQPGHGDSFFPEQPRPRPRNPYPREAFVGSLPGDAVRHQPRLQPGVPADLRWLQDFIHDLVRWVRAIAWMPGQSWSLGMSCPWNMKPASGGRSRPLRTPGCGAHACHWENDPKFCARRLGCRNATWRRAYCWAEPLWGAIASSSPSGGACARRSWPAPTSRRATGSCCS